MIRQTHCAISAFSSFGSASVVRDNAILARAADGRKYFLSSTARPRAGRGHGRPLEGGPQRGPAVAGVRGGLGGGARGRQHRKLLEFDWNRRNMLEFYSINLNHLYYGSPGV